MAESFVVESVIRGYHEYKDKPVNGKELNCIRKLQKPAFQLLDSHGCWLVVLLQKAILKTTGRLDLVSHP